MKKLFAGMLMLGTVAFASAQTITFNTVNLDYGTVKPNADGNRTFIVKNTGDKPLVISRVQPSCGCTTPDWTKEPIMPGKTGEIKVHYDTAVLGEFQKSIDVYSNDPVNGRSVIFIKGKVDPNASEVAAANANKKSAVAPHKKSAKKNTAVKK